MALGRFVAAVNRTWSPWPAHGGCGEPAGETPNAPDCHIEHFPIALVATCARNDWARARLHIDRFSEVGHHAIAVGLEAHISHPTHAGARRHWDVPLLGFLSYHRFGCHKQACHRCRILQG
jgi:hypothetical protein